MEWYWWVLIAVVAVVGGYFKLKIFKQITSRKSKPMEED